VEFSVELQWSFRWSSGRSFGGALVEFSVQLWWNFRWSSGGAPVDFRARGLSEDPLQSGAAVS
jgi:hypothetical protein